VIIFFIFEHLIASESG